MKFFIYLICLFLISCSVERRLNNKKGLVNFNSNGLYLHKHHHKNTNLYFPASDSDFANIKEDISEIGESRIIQEKETKLKLPGLSSNEPVDSIQKERSRKRFDRNLILGSLAAFSVGGLAHYINYSNEKIDPNIVNTQDYQYYKITWNFSYLVGSSLAVWRIKRGSDFKKAKEKNIVLDQDTSNINPPIQTKETEENLKKAKKLADNSMEYVIGGIISTIFLGIGILYVLIGIQMAKRSIQLAPKTPSAIKAAKAKRIALAYFRILAIIIPILLVLGIIVLVNSF